MSDSEVLKENSNKRRALYPLDNRSEMDFDTLKSFIMDQNANMQATIKKELKETIESNTKSNLQSMEQILDDKLHKFAGYVEAKIDNVRTECADSIKVLSDELSTKIRLFNDDIDERLDFLERQSKQCDIIIKNIPYRPEENMRNLVYDTCDAIKFSNVKTIKSAFRMSRSSNRSNPIVMKFYDRSDKHDFMRAYLNYNMLNLNDLGFHSKLRIIICEALTTKNNEIFKKAMYLKRNKELFSVSTKNGFVYCRLDSNSQFLHVSSLSSLDALTSAGAKTNKNIQTKDGNATKAAGSSQPQMEIEEQNTDSSKSTGGDGSV